MESLIIQLISGAIGGNVAGKALPQFNLGTLWNSVVGLVGGIGGAQLLGVILPGVLSGGMNLGSVLSTVAASGVGGAVLLSIAGLIRNRTQE